jgi:DNA-binding transcriptional MocR family regulator
MPAWVDAVRLHEQALDEHISIAPGILLSASGRYRNCVRINCAIPWSARIDRAVGILGRLAEQQRPRKD